MKRYRQSAILDLVSAEVICSQEELGVRLRALGFHATQATISRDIKELQLVKRASDGAYERPGAAGASEPADVEPADIRLRRVIVEYLRRVDLVQQLLVLRTDPGQAQPLALAIDQAKLPEVVGTVAGDDTILVITRHARAGREVTRLFEGWRAAPRAGAPAAHTGHGHSAAGAGVWRAAPRAGAPAAGREPRRVASDHDGELPRAATGAGRAAMGTSIPTVEE